MKKIFSSSTLSMVAAVVTISPSIASAQQAQERAWSIGISANYATVGGDAFQFIPDGGGMTFSTSRRISPMFAFGGGLSISLYEFTAGSPDALLDGDPNTNTGGFVTLYVESTVYFPLEVTSFTPYAGGRFGFMTGDFSHASAGWQAGAVGGVLMPLNGRVSLDLNVTANAVFTHQYDLPIIVAKSPWGRVLSAQSGVVVRLGH